MAVGVAAATGVVWNGASWFDVEADLLALGEAGVTVYPRTSTLRQSSFLEETSWLVLEAQDKLFVLSEGAGVKQRSGEDRLPEQRSISRQTTKVSRTRFSICGV